MALAVRLLSFSGSIEECGFGSCLRCADGDGLSLSPGPSRRLRTAGTDDVTRERLPAKTDALFSSVDEERARRRLVVISVYRSGGRMSRRCWAFVPGTTARVSLRQTGLA